MNIIAKLVDTGVKSPDIGATSLDIKAALLYFEAETKSHLQQGPVFFLKGTQQNEKQ